MLDAKHRDMKSRLWLFIRMKCGEDKEDNHRFSILAWGHITDPYSRQRRQRVTLATTRLCALADWHPEPHQTSDGTISVLAPENGLGNRQAECAGRITYYTFGGIPW
jgi:hypothetical protein